MPTLEATEIEQARQYFDRTRAHVMEATAGLTDEQWRFRPAADRWSIAEILEHMVTVEERVLGPLRQAMTQAPCPPADRNCRAVDTIIFERIPDRSMRANAPEPIQPTGKCTPAEALERLQRNYQGLMGWVEATPDLREHEMESAPLRFITQGAHTTMDGYQFALTVAAHDERHVRQMEEVKADPHFPR